MFVGIVGHAEEKFTPVSRARAITVITKLLMPHDAHLVSGHSPMGGVDVWAEEIAQTLGRPMTIFAPEHNHWEGVGGFRDRNMRIARLSEIVHVIVVDTYPPGFKGMRHKVCYHCARAGQGAGHVKSGGCWTARQAVAIGRRAEWHIVRHGL